MSDTLFDQLARGLARSLSPLERAAEVPGAFNGILESVGAPPDTDVAPLTAATAAVLAAKRRIEALATGSSSWEDIVAVLRESSQAFAALRQLSDGGGAYSQMTGLGRDLADLLVAAWLASTHPSIYELAVLLTLIEPAADQTFSPLQLAGDVPIRLPYRIDRFRIERLPSLLRDPAAVLRAEYDRPLLTVRDAEGVADKLFPRIVGVLRGLGVSCRYGINRGDEDALGDSASIAKHSLAVYLSDPLVAGVASEAGVVVSVSSADGGDLGLVFSPFGTLSTTRQSGPFVVTIACTAGVEAVAYGRHGLTLLADAATSEVSGSVVAMLEKPEEGPGFVIGSATGTRLEVGGAKLGLTTSLSDAHQRVAISGDVSSSALVIEAADGDGFLAKILPEGGLRAAFDLGLDWSSDGGLTLRGGAGLDATFPVGVSIAGVTLSLVHVSLQARDGDVKAQIAASVSASIGPVQVVLDRVGVDSTLTFPPAGGNLGVADLAVGFKGPSGVGVSVDAHGVLTGGGFLFHDEARALYAGTLQLTLREQITVKAYGLIATRMPDGSRGYSLLIFITAEDFRPIPLGFGFNLLGIGGIVAVNRTFDENVLRQGLASDTLGTLLFPRDPASDAPALIQSLASAFPARPGSYLLGILAKIGWFTPTLVTMDLALILEFGARTRLLVLGRVSALLPSRDNDLVRLNLDAMGVFDFDEGTAAIDAVLVDSRLAHKFALTGAAALRARFGSGPGSTFVLAVGGLNPHFAPPAGLPHLPRIAIALCSGDNPRLSCEAYFAITANTVQFGARAHLFASAIGFSVEGDVGFDVLVSKPLHFVADFHASMQLKRGSHNLFKVALQGELEGPRPLRISGKASFEILFSFSVRFDKQLVAGAPPPPPPAIDVRAELVRALSTIENWSTELVGEHTQGVTLRRLAPGDVLVLDPLGRLTVKQQMVPLNTARDIDLFGDAPVAGERRFQIAATLVGVAPGAQAQPSMPVREQFAPAQYFTLSDDEKLVAPSFEEMDAGLVFGSETTVFDDKEIVPATLNFESVVLDVAPPDAPAPLAPLSRSVVPATELHAQSGAAARAAVRRAGRARFRDDTVEPAARMLTPRWKIVPLTEGAPLAPTSGARTWSEHCAVIDVLNRSEARWQIVPAYEMEG